ncbi:uncharacterized protein [Narcine bancroftii]|uniref:uncharacterized protein n=1 Tax=Narcine bancroftii TaxID=1343680 RepID=UPI003831600D
MRNSSCMPSSARALFRRPFASAVGLSMSATSSMSLQPLSEAGLSPPQGPVSTGVQSVSGAPPSISVGQLDVAAPSCIAGCKPGAGVAINFTWIILWIFGCSKIDFCGSFDEVLIVQLGKGGITHLLPTPSCHAPQNLDFLTEDDSLFIWQQNHKSHQLSIGVFQGSVLSSLLFKWPTSSPISYCLTLLTHDCTARFSSNRIIKFEDNRTVVSLISNKETVGRLKKWCENNQLCLNVEKSKEMIVDFRKIKDNHSPLHNNGSVVEITQFLGVHIKYDPILKPHLLISQEDEAALDFLRRLRRARQLAPILTFYRNIIEIILSGCISVLYGSCKASEMAEKITGVFLASIDDIHQDHCLRRALRII